MAVRADRGPAALSPLRTVALAVGFLCAIAASVALFATKDAEYLRIGILVALWGFVFAALAAGRRQTEQAVAASAEIEVRKSYELELGREVAARREYEFRLEAQLRREVQDDFTEQVGALREELSRLRRELSEQWDSELRVERMVMRTQSVRMGGDRRESLEHELAGPASIDAASPDGGSLDAGPATSEFSAVTGAGPSVPSVPTAPVPTPAAPSSGFPNLSTLAQPDTAHHVPHDARGWSSAEPGVPADTAPGQHPADDSPDDSPDDVLTRVLAEAGRTGSSRRKHRYADEDEYGQPTGF